MRQGRSGIACGAIVALTLAVWACETTRNPGGIQRDVTSPAITLTALGDTQEIASGLRFTIAALDNLAIKSVRLTFTGGYRAQAETTFTGQNLTYQTVRTITFGSGSGNGGLITIVGRVTDGAGNFAEDTIAIFLSNVEALRVYLISPLPGALAAQTRGIPVTVAAAQLSGISRIGFTVSPRTAVDNPPNPAVPLGDSLVFTAPLADSVEYTDTLIVLAAVGTFNVEGFAEDSAGRRQPTNVVTVTIQSVVNDLDPPLVDHQIAPRVEVDDTITIRAQDPSAIEWIGFRVDTGAAGILVKFDTINVGAGNLTDVTRRMNLNLGGVLPQPFPRTIVVRGYACDRANARNCAYTNTQTLLPALRSPAASSDLPVINAQLFAVNALIDTVIVVAGVTVPFPFGGRIADAIFNGNDSTLYLTNPDLSRVEIFQVANTAFVATGIPTAGPKPWGIALWPRDTLGNYGDTIVVANSGGTELSIIDVRPGVRRLVWRQDLPDFDIQTYKVDPGPPRREIITSHQVSDRPQYVGTVCRAGAGTACHVDSVFALYSTTPTLSSNDPFSNRATLRMEKLINSSDTARLFSHLLWELSGDSTLSSLSRDTLRIAFRRGPAENRPPQQKVVLSACAGVTVQIDRFGLADTTYVRNSGNFTHAFFGEGGNIRVPFARVVGYTAKRRLIQGAATFRGCDTSPGGATTDSGFNHADLGVSPAIEVADFISNTGAVITAIATNFNGGTNLVRASGPTERSDSIYVLDEGLRLKGTVCSEQSPGSGCLIGTPGMDMNYNHDFHAGTGGSTGLGGTRDSTNRVAFTARPDGNIDVFDTFFYARIGTITVRDPITGPLRVARNRANTRQWLFGVTARGLVVVELPILPNPFPSRQRSLPVTPTVGP